MQHWPQLQPAGLSRAAQISPSPLACDACLGFLKNGNGKGNKKLSHAILEAEKGELTRNGTSPGLTLLLRSVAGLFCWKQQQELQVQRTGVVWPLNKCILLFLQKFRASLWQAVCHQLACLFLREGTVRPETECHQLHESTVPSSPSKGNFGAAPHVLPVHLKHTNRHHHGPHS